MKTLQNHTGTSMSAVFSSDGAYTRCLEFPRRSHLRCLEFSRRAYLGLQRRSGVATPERECLETLQNRSRGVWNSRAILARTCFRFNRCFNVFVLFVLMFCRVGLSGVISDGGHGHHSWMSFPTTLAGEPLRRSTCFTFCPRRSAERLPLGYGCRAGGKALVYSACVCL